MCGITGFVLQDKADKNIYSLSKMIQGLSHRGPDNISIWEESLIVSGLSTLFQFLSQISCLDPKVVSFELNKYYYFKQKYHMNKTSIIKG